MKNNITLYIKSKNNVIDITLHESSSILRVKQLIFKKYNIRIKRQLLYLNGIILKNNKSILSYNLSSTSMIEIKQFALKGGDTPDIFSCTNSTNNILIAIFTILLFIILYNGFLLRTSNLIDYAVVETIPQFFVFCKTYKQLGTIAFGLFIGSIIYTILQGTGRLTAGSTSFIFIISYIITYGVSIPVIYKVLSTPFVLSICSLILLILKHAFIIGFIFLSISYLTYGITNAMGNCQYKYCAMKVALKTGKLMTMIYYGQVILFSICDKVIEFVMNIRRDIFPFSKFFKRYTIGFTTTYVSGIPVPISFGFKPNTDCMYTDYNSYKLWMYIPLAYMVRKNQVLAFIVMLFFPGTTYYTKTNAKNNATIQWFKKTFTYGLDKYLCKRADSKQLATYMAYHQFLIEQQKDPDVNISDKIEELQKMAEKDKDSSSEVLSLIDIISGDPSINMYSDGCSEFIKQDLTSKFLQDSEKYEAETRHKIENPLLALKSLITGDDASLLYSYEYARICFQIKKYNFWKRFLVSFYGISGIDYESVSQPDPEHDPTDTRHGHTPDHHTPVSPVSDHHTKLRNSTTHEIGMNDRKAHIEKHHEESKERLTTNHESEKKTLEETHAKKLNSITNNDKKPLIDNHIIAQQTLNKKHEGELIKHDELRAKRIKLLNTSVQTHAEAGNSEKELIAKTHANDNSKLVQEYIDQNSGQNSGQNRGQNSGQNSGQSGESTNELIDTQVGGGESPGTSAGPGTSASTGTSPGTSASTGTSAGTSVKTRVKSAGTSVKTRVKSAGTSVKSSASSGFNRATQSADRKLRRATQQYANTKETLKDVHQKGEKMAYLKNKTGKFKKSVKSKARKGKAKLNKSGAAFRKAVKIPSSNRTGITKHVSTEGNTKHNPSKGNKKTSAISTTASVLAPEPTMAQSAVMSELKGTKFGKKLGKKIGMSMQNVKALSGNAIKNQLSLGMQTEPASEEILDPKIIELLTNYLRAYYTNLTSSSGLYTAWLITILCIITKDEVFGIRYRR